MSFSYFAYGSNLWPPQMQSRCPSATVVGSAVLPGWSPVYDKPSRDGSAKLNITIAAEGEVHGVVYRIDDEDRPSLDAAEHLYDPIRVTVEDGTGSETQALTYRWNGQSSESPPYDWYVALAQAGARHHGLPERYCSNHLSADGEPDPVAPGVRPATEEDLPLMQGILSKAITSGSARYSAHPGDLAWWMFHDDPRYPDHDSYWVQDETGVLVIDSANGEISAFTVPGHSPIPLIEFAQGRLGGKGRLVGSPKGIPSWSPMCATTGTGRCRPIGSTTGT